MAYKDRALRNRGSATKVKLVCCVRTYNMMMSVIEHGLTSASRKKWRYIQDDMLNYKKYIDTLENPVIDS